MNTTTRISSTFMSIILFAASMNVMANETVSPMPNPFLNKTCKAPEYEPEMIRKDASGVVKLSFTLDENGKVAQAKVEESSGVRNLDISSLSALKNCQFIVKKDDANLTKVNNLIAFRWKIE